MLITSRQTGRWVLPKGWAKRQLTGPELAALEAFEEAGLVGTIAEQAIGAYSYLKRLADGSAVHCEVDVFPMQVVELLDDWPEREQRQRRWFTLEEAAELVHEADLTMLLLNFGGMDAARAG